MFECHVCGNKSARQELTSEVFCVEGRRVLVEHIPALVCERCGEATFSSDTTEQIRELLHGETRPLRTDSIDVFALV
jgi:YgiT-type zinc finger domain-containing protein